MVDSNHLGRTLCLLGSDRRLALCIFRQRLHLRHCLAHCSICKNVITMPGPRTDHPRGLDSP